MLRPRGDCCAPGCEAPATRGSYCEGHAAVFYVPHAQVMPIRRFAGNRVWSGVQRTTESAEGAPDDLTHEIEKHGAIAPAKDPQ